MKTLAILFSFLLFSFLTGHSQESKINLVVIGAHPDDCDIDAGGTALLFAEAGHQVLFISVTNGDAGHHQMSGEALARRRMEEAQEAGRRLGVKYVVLDHHDGLLMPELEIRLELIRLIREWKADVVIGPRPNDYHPDHRNTAILVQDAAYLVIVPNIAPDTPPLKKNPVFLYSEDRFQKPTPFQPDIAVDISAVVEQKIYAMAAHQSQFFEWLPWTAGRLDEVPQKEEDRFLWLAATRKSDISPATRESLAKWYGPDQAARATAVEAFEICEYGRRPSEEQIRQLFPMLKR